ncbi:MAG: FKBP-type peptidyl-prolyl cis-trans isomerase [Bacteroidota bacterium]
MKKIVYLAFAASLVWVGCHRVKKGEVKRGEGDMIYQIIEDNGNPKIKKTDFVAVTYTVKKEDGSTLYTPYTHNIYGSPDFNGDMYDGLAKLGEGDSAMVKINIDSLIAKKLMSPTDKIKGKYLTYYIRVNKVITRIGEPSRISDSTLYVTIENYKKDEADNDQKTEGAKLQHYLAASPLRFSKTPSGLYYIIQKTGNGPKPVPGDLTKVYLTARHIDGEIFYTNDKEAAKNAGTYDTLKNYKPLNVFIGDHVFIKGFEEALNFLPKGSRATLVIPSKLSNSGRYGYIPVICEVEILDITHPTSEEKKKIMHPEDAEGKQTSK